MEDEAGVKEQPSLPIGRPRCETQPSAKLLEAQKSPETTRSLPRSKTTASSQAAWSSKGTSGHVEAILGAIQDLKDEVVHVHGKLQEIEAENRLLKREIQEAKEQMMEKLARIEDQVMLESKHVHERSDTIINNQNQPNANPSYADAARTPMTNSAAHPTPTSIDTPYCTIDTASAAGEDSIKTLPGAIRTIVEKEIQTIEEYTNNRRIHKQ
ncbi:hypothetical protein K469DRAFT_754775 [Zopfia rhizophila CBS 207.26]|uniref:Uncharacterized protein n=1 Tax=Zopfia rhizophila CBS 207.26 TaxID=1314779 RepID=A0A6A6DEY9_9PEZI|nr:hypothetical protein K469DRAFT_754775 [Zopfia rhizophila CBS 207.26]